MFIWVTLTNASKAAGLDNLLKLLGNEVGRIPGPEVTLGVIIVPLATLGRVGYSVRENLRHLQEGNGTRQTSILTVRILEDGGLAADGCGACFRGLKVLRVEGETQRELAGVETELKVLIDRVQRLLDGCVVVRGSIASRKYLVGYQMGYYLSV